MSRLESGVAVQMLLPGNPGLRRGMANLVNLTS
jgi:hypothetical protein